MNKNDPWAMAADRVKTFITARDRHVARIAKRSAMMGRKPTNPFPNLIIAEYGTLDIDDLRILTEQNGLP